jgi:hypothetical protein
MFVIINSTYSNVVIRTIAHSFLLNNAIFGRYDELSSKGNVEYIAGGIVFLTWNVSFHFLILLNFLTSENVFRFPGATQNSIRVAQVSFEATKTMTNQTILLHLFVLP